MLSTEDLAELVSRMRLRKGLSRGQVAKRLKLTPTVVYNVETGRSRIKLSYFIGLMRITGHEPKAALGRHLSSIKQLQTTDGAELVRGFRGRLKLSQRELGGRLGYRGASIIHHFEKGIREPDIGDLFELMALARDNVRGLVHELAADAAFAARFPEGREAAQEDWGEYWGHFYVSAIRQIMRTRPYRDLARFKLGYFAAILGITAAQERHALAVLKKFGVIRWEQAKPVVVPGVRIAVPKGAPRALLDQFKVQWLAFSQQRYLADDGSRSVLTVDSIPVSESAYREIVQRIRDLQDEFHNLPLREADGFVQLSWLAAYVPVA